jgi:hypothetical protein
LHSNAAVPNNASGCTTDVETLSSYWGCLTRATPVPTFNPVEIDEARPHVQRLFDELVEKHLMIDALTKDAAGLEAIVRGYFAAFPELCTEQMDIALNQRETPTAARPSGSPRGADAVRLILQDEPGVLWLVSALVLELKDRGWLPDSDNPANAVRAALERLTSADDSDVYKERRGHNVYYVYDPDRAPSLPYGEEEPF